MPERMYDVDLVVMSWDEFLALHQTTFSLIFPSDDVDLSIEQTHSEVSPLALH